jgi:hypothetical protein
MTEEELLAYEGDTETEFCPNGAIVHFRHKKNPFDHWLAPFVTGHRYYIRWSYGLDFTKMDIQISDFLWQEDAD